MAYSGLDFLLKCGGFNDNPITLGGMRATTMVLNNETIDITHKESQGMRTLLPKSGIQSLTITASGIFTNAESEQFLKQKAFSRELGLYSLFFPNGEKFQAHFLVTQYERSGDHNGEETYNVTLESSGAIVFGVQNA